MSFFKSHFWKYYPRNPVKNMIFGFWFSTCRRKKCWGFRIWPYFFWKVGQKWSKLTIFQRIPKCWKMDISWKAHFFDYFRPTFLTKEGQNRLPWKILHRYVYEQIVYSIYFSGYKELQARTGMWKTHPAQTRNALESII